MKSIPFRALALRPAAGAFFMLAFASVPALPVDNPSFESGPDPGVAIELPVGSTAITGWVVTRAPIDYVGTRWNAIEGTRSLGLNGTSPGGIAQTLATVPGGAYTVRFFLAGDAFSNPVLKHLRVEAAGQSQDYEFDATHSWEWDLGWLEQTFAFTASSTTTVLEFWSLDAGSTGPTLDDVRIEGPPTDVARDDLSPVALGTPLPNPSSDGFQLTFSLPTAAPVHLAIWDAKGREVAVLAAGPRPGGSATLRWDGTTALGRAPAGVYFVRLESAGRTQSHKAVLVAP